jgi:D-sedoheptulose 7-phosphate isomerase
MNKIIISEITSSIETKQKILENLYILKTIEAVAGKIVEAYKNGNKTIFAGNGGSAADSQHLAGELVSRFYFDRPALSSISLTTDTSILTAIGNDYGYEEIFSRQIEANGKSGDIFIAISTSGNSKNIIKAVQTAKLKNIIVVGLTGEKGGELAKISDFSIQVPSNITPRIQESHILIGHILAGLVESAIFS